MLPSRVAKELVPLVAMKFGAASFENKGTVWFFVLFFLRTLTKITVHYLSCSGVSIKRGRTITRCVKQNTEHVHRRVNIYVSAVLIVLNIFVN